MEADLLRFLAAETRVEMDDDGSYASALLSKHSLANLLSRLRAASADGDDGFVDVLCRVLARVLVAPRVLDSARDVQGLREELLDGLSSGREAIRKSTAVFFSAVAAGRFAAAARLRLQLFDPPCLAALCARLADDNVAVGEAAVKTLAALAKVPADSVSLEPPPSTVALVDALAAFSVSQAGTDSSVAVRFFSAICAVCGSSHVACSLAEAAGLLRQVRESNACANACRR
jgi:hypothetical protein